MKEKKVTGARQAERVRTVEEICAWLEEVGFRTMDPRDPRCVLEPRAARELSNAVRNKFVTRQFDYKDDP